MMRQVLFAFLALLCAATAVSAQAPISIGKTLEGTTTVYTATGATAGANGSAVYLPEHTTGLIFRLVATNNSGTTPTLDVRIQHSLDGSTWVNLPNVAFTQVTTGSATEELHIDLTKIKYGSRVRAVTTFGGTDPNYTLTVTAIHD